MNRREKGRAAPHFDIALDVVPRFWRTYVAGLDHFNKKVLANDFNRYCFFKSHAKGLYLRLPHPIKQTDFFPKKIQADFDEGYRLAKEAIALGGASLPRP